MPQAFSPEHQGFARRLEGLRLPAGTPEQGGEGGLSLAQPPDHLEDAVGDAFQLGVDLGESTPSPMMRGEGPVHGSGFQPSWMDDAQPGAMRQAGIVPGRWPSISARAPAIPRGCPCNGDNVGSSCGTSFRSAAPNPNGILSQSPGLAGGTTAYPGNAARANPTPTGLCPGVTTRNADTTPLGLQTCGPGIPG